ncbi:P-loop NTPase [Natrialba sp. INN-245]|nr:P-loop NTPase [Natrialba sp. INN-245]
MPSPSGGCRAVGNADQLPATACLGSPRGRASRLQGPTAVLRGPMVDKILIQLIEEVEWGNLDYLVVDLPPGTGDAQLTLLQTLPVTGSVVVTTPEEVATDDVRKGIEMFRNHDTPVLGIAENMSAYHCPDCGCEHALFGTGGGREVAETYDVPLLEEIPMNPEIRTRSDDGAPVVLWETDASESFEDLVESVRSTAPTSPESIPTIHRGTS